MSIYTVSCGVCQKPLKSLRSLARHLQSKHPEYDSKKYFDEFMKTPEDGVCVICGSPTKYRNMGERYLPTCSHSCGAIRNRRLLAADPVRNEIFLGKMSAYKTAQWQALDEAAKKDRIARTSASLNVRYASMTKQERREMHSRYYTCDEETIERLNRTSAEQCFKNWKSGANGWGVNSKMAYKGRFKPNNPEKYDGDPTGIIYRSQWECRFMSYLDSNPGVIKWSSEEIVVPYYDEAQKKWRRYFPDFYVVVKNGTGTLTQLIEIKPFKECSPPLKSPTAKTNRRYIRESLTYVTNQCKWKAAESYCADRNWKFKVITEKDLNLTK